MSFETAQNDLQAKGYGDRIIVTSQSSATVALAAQALGIEEGRIAKTLSFMVGDVPVLILAAGNARVDNHKYKETFHKKAKMMSEEQLAEYVGHQPGGVCPFGVKDDRVQIYLDESLKAYDEVYPACGSAASAVRLSIADLENCSGFCKWINVTK